MEFITEQIQFEKEDPEAAILLASTKIAEGLRSLSRLGLSYATILDVIKEVLAPCSPQ
jgi:hypothetical protein